MVKKKGVHFYVEVKNLLEIISKEQDKDDDLKRTLHRLNTFFIGISKVIKDYGGIVEKYTNGRAHVSFECDIEDGSIDVKIIEAMVACYIFTNNIFNNLSKYNLYTGFGIHGGIDLGDYFEHTIIGNDESEEYTSIGNVANTSAKIQYYAHKDYIYATGKIIDCLSSDIKSSFTEMTDDEKSQFSGKLKETRIFRCKYNTIFSDKVNDRIKYNLEDVKEKVKIESNSLNLKDISFEGCSQQLDFSNLSLKGTNKRLEQVAIVCADIRGFSKLFEIDDSNLDNLSQVMETIYKIMDDCAFNTSGTRVQYQGDRIVILYNNFSGQEVAPLRALKCALTLNKKIKSLNEDEEIVKKLDQNHIGIGIGCGIGKVIATRLGWFGSKDNIVLGKSYQDANKAEDEYAEVGYIVISKSFKDYIYNNSKKDKIDFKILNKLFESISTTGFYATNAIIDDFDNEYEEEVKKQVKKLVFTRQSNEPRVWSDEI